MNHPDENSILRLLEELLDSRNDTISPKGYAFADWSIRPSLGSALREQIQGLSIDWTIADGFKAPVKPKDLVVYSHPDYPEAEVTVRSQFREAKDPRHPNPSAGRQTIYIVCAEGKRLATDFHALEPAKMRASDLHDHLIKKIQKKAADALAERQRKTPNFGRF